MASFGPMRQLGVLVNRIGSSGISSVKALYIDRFALGNVFAIVQAQGDLFLWGLPGMFGFCRQSGVLS